MQRLNKKQTVSDSSALHTELLSSPGPLAKELQYVGADVKQSVITDKNIIPESTKQNSNPVQFHPARCLLLILYYISG